MLNACQLACLGITGVPSLVSNFTKRSELTLTCLVWVQVFVEGRGWRITYWGLRVKEQCTRTNMIPMTRIYLLYLNSSNHSGARHHDLECKKATRSQYTSYSVRQKQIFGDLKTYLATEMSQNNTLTRGKLHRCKSQRSDMQTTAGIMQTYDLLKLAIALSNCSTLLKFPPYNTTWSALHKHEWSLIKVEGPNRDDKCHKP